MSIPTVSVIRKSDLAQIALLQLITFAARGLVNPFINLYLVSVGFTGTQIGFLTSLSALIQLFMAPTLHSFADRRGRHRRLYYHLLQATAAATIGLVVSVNYFWLGGMVLLRDTSDLSGNALLSQLTITWLEQRNRRIYGQLRAWGSFGWAVTTMISGKLFALGGYGLLFIIAGIMNIVIQPVIKILPTRIAEPRKRSEQKPSRERSFYLLLASVFLFSVGATAVNSFIYIYFKRDLGATTENIGVLSAVAALSEIPAMMLIDRLLRRADIRFTFMIGMVGMGILWFAFATLQGTALLIPLMLTRGTFFTLQSVSIILLISWISDATQVATNQGIVQVTIPGLAVLLTGSLSGWLFDHIGPRPLFQIAGLMAFLATLLLFIARRNLKLKSSNVL